MPPVFAASTRSRTPRASSGARLGTTRGAIATASTSPQPAQTSANSRHRSTAPTTAASSASAATHGVKANSGTTGQTRSSPSRRMSVQATSAPASPQRRPRSSMGER